MKEEQQKPFVYYREKYQHGSEAFHEEELDTLYAACKRALELESWNIAILAVVDENGESMRPDKCREYIEREDLSKRVKLALVSRDERLRDALIVALARRCDLNIEEVL